MQVVKQLVRPMIMTMHTSGIDFTSSAPYHHFLIPNFLSKCEKLHDSLLCTCSNDVFDANTGVDENKKESIVNLTGKPRLILWLSISMLFSGVGLLVHSLGTLNRAAASCLLSFSIICGYIYQGPPFR